ncbi:SNF2 family N-terminal domain-containing protein [Vararia minispora EC-137]|uniref:SNF2 family N-terminal domain-containing protein n=1 Tax=Vararia minispora EC-137 TaxID=1314806 RepID=A0ACB8QEU8_9AGAM|nr:SNF2 family N-terminal domain-containing protein [Vararia minispora EC-137]
MALPTRQSAGNGASRAPSILRSRSTTDTPDPTPSSGSRPHNVFVELPRLPRTVDRSAYTSPMEYEIPPELEPQEIIGEYSQGETLWYFAKHMDGIAHKYDADDLERDFPNLVSSYKRRKNRGKLLPFDPSATYVHPRSRVNITIKIGKPDPSRKIAPRKSAAGSSKDIPLIIESDSGGEVWDDDVPEDALSTAATSDLMGDSDAADSSTPNLRRSTRQKPKQSKLQFSTKRVHTRTRARGLLASDDEGSPSGSAPSTPAAARRSTRARKSARVNLDDTYVTTSEESGDDGDDDYRARRSKGATGSGKKKTIRGKAARPAYGRVRSIADLDLDPLDDLDTAALRAHRDTCEKCSRPPTHTLLKRKGSRKRKDDDEFAEQVDTLGGWVRCLKCPLSAHWLCLASTQREEILKAARALDRKEWEAARDKALERGQAPPPEPERRKELTVEQTTEFVCAMCMKGGICMNCRETALEPDRFEGRTALTSPSSKDMDQDTQSLSSNDDHVHEDLTQELLFRCITCRRLAHYRHLPVPDGLAFRIDREDPHDRAKLAHFYHDENKWQCNDCSSYINKVEKILAWRPYPDNAAQPSFPPGQPPPIKVLLPREYLVKWQDRPYRRCDWVPHGWLSSLHGSLLRSFLASGPRVELLKEAVTEDKVANDFAEGGVGEIADESRDSSARPDDTALLGPCPDAERRIPPAWKTTDRVLDCRLFYVRPKPSRMKHKRKAKSRTVTDSEDEDEEMDTEALNERNRAFEYGSMPDEKFIETVNDYERRTGSDLTADDVDKVIWALIKWDDLGYEDASWDAPPRSGEPGYAAFKSAFQHFLGAREITVPVLSPAQAAGRDGRKINEYRNKYSLTAKAAKLGLDVQPDLGQNPELKLMPFQVEGFDWLCNNWWNKQQCILADEMGLGKTVQICTFIGNIIQLKDAFPILVVVPNSTITNWVREFARWAPSLRVVPFYGEAKAREVLKTHELFHSHPAKGTTGAKFHVLVTTYNTITNAREVASVFKSQPRWEVLIIDEGQRLNNDNSLLFKKLKELNALHRIIMTGTPLNNNIRELFNLMNFLDPDVWNNLDKLAADYRDEELTDERIRDLHEKLRPYFLRRIKSEVLKLPPKNEVIVPVSLTPLQKEMYKGILSKNVNILATLAQSSSSSKPRASSSVITKANMNNMLMQLRKCIQHPYLLSQDIEPKGLDAIEAHERLIGASAKLRLLHNLLPKLRTRGHRVLLFSQFVIALDIIEDFLNGEGIRYLRLDGNTKQSDRQKGMDEFNRPGSEVFMYLLTTRAGGVGINLWSADTVIIFDPDFNPHQAIARAHRYGQQKPCLVFKLMAKDTAEERIFQTGKKKLVLDHLIVQKMDDDETGTDIQSILTYGAKTLFEEDDQTREIIYADHDLDNLIERTESEVAIEGSGEETTGQAFSFAKIWTTDKDTLEELRDATEEPESTDTWALTLQRIAEERKKMDKTEASGRGVRRKAANQNFDFMDTPQKKGKGKKHRESPARESDGWEAASQTSGDASDASYDASDEFFDSKQKQKHKETDLRGIDDNDDKCGLCGKYHDGPCQMADSSENLARYRQILFEPSEESYESKCQAIEILDRTLAERGHLHLIQGQPLFLAPPRAHPFLPLQATRTPPAPRQQPIIDSVHVEPPGPSVIRSSKPAARPTPNLHAQPSRPVSSRQATSLPEPRPSLSVQNAKRPTERSAEDAPVQKRFKSTSLCPVCMQEPRHLVKDCPVVAKGLPSIAKAIVRLERDEEHKGTVAVLRQLERQQKRKEAVGMTIGQSSS